MRATKVNAGLAESNGRLLLGIWRDSLHVTCGLTACIPGSAPGPTLGNEYGKTLPLPFLVTLRVIGHAYQRDDLIGSAKLGWLVLRRMYSDVPFTLEFANWSSVQFACCEQASSKYVSK